MGRFAPSPSGRLHLGNARTALLSWLQIRAAGGRYVMRVEDLDPQRSKAEHEQRQLADLRWLGLDWDEGPDVGGPRGPYRQSERHALYVAALERLDTYPCTCTRRELRAQIEVDAPHGVEPVYAGTCREGPTHPERPASSRWRIPASAPVCFVDRILGERCQDIAREVGDFVLRRADHGDGGAWAYQLAVVVDDAAMGVSEVLRGADLLDSTPRQILLQRSLGLATPRYAHAPLIVGPDGDKLSKRHGAPDLSALRERGVDPRLVVAALARSAGLLGDHPGLPRCTAEELRASFELSQIPREPGVLDVSALG
ncbi:tRNA glutamyl-Q(34) synthetase GluQRS [Pseudenhygromyxa sp. WMMC2535]|uniref:tRNA glutamyl-Q(34) synthetase GluQRS n=1 Tax=Pseudenhygromyxa sp. WMMC2535 TaxID=2712867 RepID=UPI0031F9254B